MELGARRAIPVDKDSMGDAAFADHIRNGGKVVEGKGGGFGDKDGIIAPFEGLDGGARASRWRVKEGGAWPVLLFDHLDEGRGPGLAHGKGALDKRDGTARPMPKGAYGHRHFGDGSFWADHGTSTAGNAVMGK